MRKALLACLAGLVCAASSVQAQATGTVTGVVTSDAGTPLSGVSVSVSGQGTLSDEAGRFTIERVPAGQHTLRATLIGYEQHTEAVAVTAGQVVTVDVELTDEAAAPATDRKKP